MDILNSRPVKTSTTLLLFIILFAAGSGTSISSYKATQKQKVVAGAVFKFIKFVEWENKPANQKVSFARFPDTHPFQPILEPMVLIEP